jgi:hypothetical protein
VKLKDLARVLVLKSSLEVGESFLGLFLVIVALLFHLVNIIIEISWSREEIWEKVEIDFLYLLATLLESHCNQVERV